MRKITEESINAFYSRKRFKKQNTEVYVDDNITLLKLHKNIIAVLYTNDDLRITTAGWDTKTTRERLNGLSGVKVTSRNGQLKLNGENWNGNLKQINSYE